MSDVLEIFETAVEKAKKVRYDEMFLMKFCVVVLGFFCGAAFASVFKKRVVVCTMVVLIVITALILLNKYYGKSVAGKCRQYYKSAKSASFLKK